MNITYMHITILFVAYCLLYALEKFQKKQRQHTHKYKAGDTTSSMRAVSVAPSSATGQMPRLPSR